jgi:hypothetical protein
MAWDINFLFKDTVATGSIHANIDVIRRKGGERLFPLRDFLEMKLLKSVIITSTQRVARPFILKYFIKFRERGCRTRRTHSRRFTRPDIYTVAAESFYTCSSKIRLFTVYWRMVLAYGRGW